MNFTESCLHAEVETRPLSPCSVTRLQKSKNGQMLLMQPSNRIVEEEESTEQWPTETSDNLNGQKSFDMGMNLASMGGQNGFNDQTTYQEETSVADFGEDQERDDLSPHSSISSKNGLALGMSQTLSLSQQQQQPFLPYTSWNVEDATNLTQTSTAEPDSKREADLYTHLQQNFNGAIGINNLENVNGIDQLTAHNGDMWADSGMGLDIEGLGSGPEAVEQ